MTRRRARGGVGRSAEAGFTLTEALAAMALLAVALVAVLASTSAGVTGVDEARRSTSALFLAEQRMEQVKAFALSTAPGQGWANLRAARFPDEAYGTIAGYPDYRRRVVVVDNPGGAPFTKQVEVYVYYRPVKADRLGPETGVVLSTLLVSR